MSRLFLWKLFISVFLNFSDKLLTSLFDDFAVLYDICFGYIYLGNCSKIVSNYDKCSSKLFLHIFYSFLDGFLGRDVHTTVYLVQHYIFGLKQENLQHFYLPFFSTATPDVEISPQQFIIKSYHFTQACDLSFELQKTHIFAKFLIGNNPKKFKKFDTRNLWNVLERNE